MIQFIYCCIVAVSFCIESHESMIFLSLSMQNWCGHQHLVRRWKKLPMSHKYLHIAPLFQIFLIRFDSFSNNLHFQLVCACLCTNWIHFYSDAMTHHLCGTNMMKRLCSATETGTYKCVYRIRVRVCIFIRHVNTFRL